MISVSKKVVALVAAAIVSLLVVNIVLVVNAGGGSESSSPATSDSSSTSIAATTTEETTASSSAVEESTSTTSPASDSSSTTQTTTAAPVSSAAPAVKTKTTTPAAKAPAKPLTKLAQLRAALAKANEAGGYTYTGSITVGDTEVEAAGTADLAYDKTYLRATVGGLTTEFRRIGTVFYVNAQQLGSTSAAWVQLDAAQQSAGIATKTIRSFVENVAPLRLLAALNKATRAIDLGVDSYGRHFQATVGQSTLRFVPLVDVIDQTGDIGTSVVDVWVDSTGQVNRIASTSSATTAVFTLDTAVERAAITSPTAGDVGGLTSTSGTVVFGTEPASAASTTASHDITASPTTSFVDGVIRGKLNATSATGDGLRFDSLGGAFGGKLDVGTVPNGTSTTDPQSFTVLPFAKWLEKGGAKGTETFGVRIREVTNVGRFMNNIVMIGKLAKPVIDLLQDTSDTASRVAPVVGVAETTNIDVKVDALAPADTRLAFTTFVTSFDDTKISVNFFPYLGQRVNPFNSTVLSDAPAVLAAAGLGLPGATNPYATSDSEKYVPGPATLREAKFNVITWDPRGSYASEGTLQLNNFFYERRDVTAIITWAADQVGVTLNGSNDPAVGMVGSSYGGTIQLLTGGSEPRIDGLVPTNAWSSLVTALQPGKIANITAVTKLLTSLTNPRIRLNEEVEADLKYALANGNFTAMALARLSSSTAGATLAQSQAPTLFVQSTTDPIVPVGDSLTSAKSMMENPYGTPVKILWFDGNKADSKVTDLAVESTLAWLDQYVNPVQDADAGDKLPDFRWQNQRGEWETVYRNQLDAFPFEKNFLRPQPLTGRTDGGTLTVSDTAISSGKIDATIAIPADTRSVGAPSLRFSYTGNGNAKALFARVVDVSTGLSLTPTFTPVPVVLDGQARTVDMSLQNIAYTATSSANLRLEIRTSADGFKYSGAGQLTISKVEVDIPVVAPRPV